MSATRNRRRQTSSLEERLLKFADESRKAAQAAAPGGDQEKLLRKARQAQSMADAAHRLKS
jgi:hypothetical protein